MLRNRTDERGGGPVARCEVLDEGGRAGTSCWEVGRREGKADDGLARNSNDGGVTRALQVEGAIVFTNTIVKQCLN